MARVTNGELLARIAQLETENAALRESVERGGAADEADAIGGRRDAGTTTAEDSRRRERGWGWTLLATVLIVIGAILAPVAVVASWAKVQLTDTDSFIAAYAPLANDPGVQAFVTDQTVDVIEEN